MRPPPHSRLVPGWMFTYTGVIMLTGILVNLAAGFTQFAFSLTLPSMELQLSLSHTAAGFVVTLTAVARIVSALVAGTLAPRYGSRLIVGVGSIAAGGAMLIMGFAESYLMVLLAAVPLGVATGMALTPMMGLLSRWFRSRDRGLAAGLAATGGSFAFIIAGLVVPFLTDLDPLGGWRNSWRLFGVIVIAIGALALIFLRERPQVDPNPQVPAAGNTDAERGSWPISVYKNPLVWLVTLLAFTSGWSQNIFTTFFGVFLSTENGVSLATAGQLVVLIGVLSVVSGVFWGRLSDRLSRAQAFFFSFLVQGAAFLLMALVPVLPSFIIAAVLIGFTLRAAYTICAASAGDYVPVRFSSAAFGLMSMGAGMGSAFSPTIGGAVADSINMNWTFVLASAGAVAGMAGSLYLGSKPVLSDVLVPEASAPTGAPTPQTKDAD